MPVQKRPVAIIPPANPPAQYDQRYMQQLAATVKRLVESFANYPALTASQVVLSEQDTSPSGLPVGTVYLKTLASGEKVLSIVLATDPQ